MKTNKKSLAGIIAAIISVSMVVTMLTALQSCDNGTPDADGDTQAPETDEDGSEVIKLDENFVMQEQTDKLVVYTMSMTGNAFTAAVNIFKEKYPAVDVQIVNMSDEEYETVLRTELAAGKGPDLVFSFNSDIDLYKIMSTDIFVDLNQFIGRDSEFNPDDYVKEVLDAGVYKGKRYFMPIDYRIPLLTTTQEILDEEGITPEDLNTFDGFLKAAEKYIEKYKDNPDKSVFIQIGSWYNLYYLSRYSGIEYIDYRTNTVSIDKAKFKNIMDLVKSMYYSDEDGDSDHVRIDASNILGGGLFNRKGLFNYYFETTCGGLFFNQQGWLINENLNPLLFTYPGINNKVTAEAAYVLAIPKGSKNQINAYNLMKILLSEEIQGGYSESGNQLKYLEFTPVLKSAVSALVKGESRWHDSFDEETLNAYADIMTNIDSATLGIPKAVRNFVTEEMTPYFEGTRSFDDCYDRLINKLEIYKDE